MKSKSFLTNLIPFYFRVTHRVGEGKAVDVFTWTSVKFLTLSHKFSWRNWLLMAWMGAPFAE